MSSRSNEIVDRQAFERLYARYNRREFVHPDPLEFLYDYPDLRDREIVALIASSLAYGRVAQILRSVSGVLDQMGRSPSEFLLDASSDSLRSLFSGFKHRFTTADELVELLAGMRRVLERYGSLGECFRAGLEEGDETVMPALERFVDEFRLARSRENVSNSLLPSPRLGSACKRLNLFLRWMVRKDDVDPGGWEDVGTSRLVIPLDTHMHRLGLAMCLTQRRGADIRCALDITETFRGFAPEDPVRYDFALTRLGIRDDADPESFLGERIWSEGLAYA